MSLRRRITLVFLVVNAVTILLLVFYVRVQTGEIRRQFFHDQREITKRTARLLATSFKYSIERELSEKFTNRRYDNPVGFAIGISDLAYWDEDELVRSHLDRAMLIQYDATDTIIFNPRRRLRFEPRHGERSQLRRVRELIEATTDTGHISDGGTGLIVYGRIDPGLATNWGFYFKLKEAKARRQFDPERAMRAVLTLTIPGTIFLLAFLFFFFRRSVLQPLEATERAALRISAGDYGQPLAYASEKDELGAVARAMNLMMSELAKYRDHMEGLVEDASQRFKQAERQLIVAQRLAAMGKLAAGIAHEINNPLGGILNALHKLSDPELTADRRRRNFQLAEDAVRRIQEIVRRVLATTPRRGHVGPVGVADVVDQSAGLVQHRLQQEGIALVRDVDEGLTVVGDRHELSQVFLNLFINACDAMPSGGSLRVAAARVSDHAEIRVSDSGQGMDAETSAQVFDLFFTTKPGNKGTGLGLGIVHNIVVGHGGTISVASEPGKGTEFLITLPCANGS